MELIIIIIMIVISVLNAQNKRGDKEKRRANGPVFRKEDIAARREEQISAGVRDMEDAINSLKNKMLKKAKREEEETYQKQQQERRRIEEEERKRREAQEQRKLALEQKKKQQELRKKQLEKEKKAKEEQELLKRFDDVTVCDHKKESGEEAVCAKQEKAAFSVEDYLDPLTASFYPDVEDYLFPTIAPFYPDVDVSSFSLQNQMDVLK